MRRSLLLLILLAGCGGSQENLNPPPPEATPPAPQRIVKVSETQLDWTDPRLIIYCDTVTDRLIYVVKYGEAVDMEVFDGCSSNVP